MCEVIMQTLTGPQREFKFDDKDAAYAFYKGVQALRNEANIVVLELWDEGFRQLPWSPTYAEEVANA